jgi:hypothetical protein
MKAGCKQPFGRKIRRAPAIAIESAWQRLSGRPVQAGYSRVKRRHRA